MEKKQTRGAGFAIWTGLTALVFAALLELNKNTLLAWGECAAVLLVYVLLWRRRLRGARFWKRALGWLGLAVVLTLVLLGVVLGAGYNRHGYWGSALLHALYNAAVLVLSARELQISVITMVLFVAAFCFALRGYLEKEEPDETDSSGL